MTAALPAAARALTPLWALTTGCLVGAAGAVQAGLPGPGTAHAALLLLAAAALVAACGGRRGSAALWLAAGLAAGAGRGLAARAGELELQRLWATVDVAAVRLEATVVDGWTPSRWGHRTTVAVASARHREGALPMPARIALEVRGDGPSSDLPQPGAAVAALAGLQAEPDRAPRLVVSSRRLVEATGPPRGLHRLRDRIAAALSDAAGTDVDRLRAASLAAALVVGRRDLLPAGRREGWRSSGLAHMLAVSGLHVGLVTGMAWLAALAVGASHRTARLLVAVLAPGYAVLAGGAPSALRAAAMVVLYVGARLLGRALVPLAAVLAAASLLVLAVPLAVRDPGLQLTVGITAALVAWVPALAARLRGPDWLATAIAVPIVAQLAAQPIVIAHFRTVVPGSALVNLLVPPLLAPLLAASVAAAALAQVAGTLAVPLLEAVAAGNGLLWWIGGIGRAASLATTGLGTATIVVLAAAAWLALLPGRPRAARTGAALWVLAGLALAVLPLVRLPGRASAAEVALLPVRDGAATLVRTATGTMLVDGGRLTREALELLSESRVPALDAVVASHGDEDHLGGLGAVVDALRVRQLIVPAWLRSDPAAADLLRRARRAGIAVIPTARGHRLAAGGARIDVLWPPCMSPPEDDNERSLVLRIEVEGSPVLVTSDVGHPTELRLRGSTALAADLLVVAHHGSRQSTSSGFLDAVAPQVALIPAGTATTHGHPHAEVIARLADRGIPWRAPVTHGPCGARLVGHRWRPYP